MRRTSTHTNETACNMDLFPVQKNVSQSSNDAGNFCSLDGQFVALYFLTELRLQITQFLLEDGQR